MPLNRYQYSSKNMFISDCSELVQIFIYNIYNIIYNSLPFSCPKFSLRSKREQCLTLTQWMSCAEGPVGDRFYFLSASGSSSETRAEGECEEQL
jgi:hypothetical protein